MKMGHHIHQALIDLLHPAGELPRQLARRHPGPGGSLGVNQVHHRLGLSQVQLAVQKGPPGKLPRQRLSGPLGKKSFQSQCKYHR